MKGIAFFVEGATEYDFILQLLQSKYAFWKPLPITDHVCILDSTDNRYRARISNAASDSRVKDELWDSQEKLQEIGYSTFLCIRDLRGEWKKNKPKTLSDVVKIKNADSKILKLNNDDNLSLYSILAVMETETWFITETSHYERINPKLTRPFIEANIDNIEGNVNPFVCSPKAIYEPAETLKSIYKLVGLIYEKDANHRRRTIRALDYNFFDQRSCGKNRTRFTARIDSGKQIGTILQRQIRWPRYTRRSPRQILRGIN
ncbi:MAG: hypothetical protein J6X05_04380 [Bacteroidales bacterium]|nr:hypothetical protein [Bacteroidales bacterium]